MLFIELDRTHERTYAKQIYVQIRKKINFRSTQGRR
jgi:hypothetical protein